MSQDLAETLYIHSLLNASGREGMAKHMKIPSAELTLFQYGSKAILKASWVHRTAVTTENVTVSIFIRAERQNALHQHLIHGNGTQRRVTLWKLDLQFCTM